MYTHIATQKPLLEMYLDEMCEERKSMVNRIHEHVATEYDTIYEARGSTLLSEEEEQKLRNNNIITFPIPPQCPWIRYDLWVNASRLFRRIPHFRYILKSKRCMKDDLVRFKPEGIDMGLAESLAFGRCGVGLLSST